MKKRNKEPSKKKLVKIPVDEFEKIQELANTYTGGNTSMWIKYAALNHRPNKDELEG